MDIKQPKIYVIAGPNGSGKTTSAKTLLPEILECYEYVNADHVALALSPFNPDAMAMRAGRLMLNRIHELANKKVSFAFETTLASRTFLRFLKECKNKGYEINLLYLWLRNHHLAINRVKSRVAQGGHDIPNDVIMRRYYASMKNFLNDYIEVADNWALFDNSEGLSDLIVYKKKNSEIKILDDHIWQIITGRKLDVKG